MASPSAPGAEATEAAARSPRAQVIVAINDPWHDSAYAVFDGSAIRHVEVERLTRRKYERLDTLVAVTLLEPDLIAKADLLLVEDGYVYAPFLRALAAGNKPDPAKLAAQIVAKNEPFLPEGTDPDAAHEALLFALTRLADGALPFRIYGHHFCHAVNAFLSSPFADALSVSLDGGGLQWIDGRQVTVHGSAYEFSRSAPIADRPLGFVRDWSPGWAWYRAGLPVGLDENEAGTMMAMAAYGKRHRVLEAIVRSRTFWSVSPAEIPRWRRRVLGLYDRLIRRLTRSEAGAFALGLAVQRETERRIRAHLARLLAGRGEVDLCLSGGTFLNCIVTSKVREWFPQVRDVFVPPVPYDAGLCIGMIQHHLHSEGPQDPSRAPFYPFASPPLYSPESIAEACAAAGLVAQQGVAVETVAGLLDSGAIVAHFQGCSESGRRALGNRSILCDPRKDENRQRLNATIKRRQWFRPFAPMVLAEEAHNWFVLPDRFSSPYMSFAPRFREGMGAKVPAVRHADDSARVQTVHRELTPRTHALLEAWFARTGVPILLNTSFNEHEPIVETPREAIATFLRSGIDALFFADTGWLLTHPSRAAR